MKLGRLADASLGGIFGGGDVEEDEVFRGRVQRVRSTGRGRREDARQWEKRQWWRWWWFAEEVFSGGRFGWAGKILEEKVKAFAISRNMECIIVWDNNNYHTNNSGTAIAVVIGTGLSEKERAEDVGDGVGCV